MSKFNNFKNYNPDILETIANLSNDEVFTPPKLANEILDLLPEEVWSNPNLTFLDPAVKTGIFLREITSRLIDGLADQIPDLQERVNHILTKQVFGIGITELTTLMARRTVYCSTTANGPFSICTEFDDEKGNIIFPDTEHTFNERGRCEICGANEDRYERESNLENHAYPFLHKDIEEVFGEMKFDVIIGNPPYQLGGGEESGNSFYATAIYHLFIDMAFELNPSYISMIIPSRWMSRTAGGVPQEWMDKMISNRKFKEIYDYSLEASPFSDVAIAGGVNYFLWDKSYEGKCCYTYKDENGEYSRIGYLDPLNVKVVIRNPNHLEVLNKIIKIEGDSYYSNSNSFSSIVSSSHFFGRDKILSTTWRDYASLKDDIFNVKYHLSKRLEPKGYAWIKESQVQRHKEVIDKHKVFTVGNSAGRKITGRTIYGEPRSVCSQSYLVVGYNKEFTKEECMNMITYMKTKLFRFLVSMSKSTSDIPKRVYQFVPLQDFSKPWTDEELYAKYKLTEEEIAYIEDNIDPMGDQDDSEEAYPEDSVDPDNSEFED